MEGVQSRPADQCRLIRDPKMSNTVEGVRKDDASVPQADLEDWAMLLDPRSSDSGMV